MTFPGFPKETLAFLDGISANNEKAWFEANRPLYEAGYVAPARALVAELGPRLAALAPGIRFEPRINGSIARINRDIRFSKDKRPYKDHLDFWFWHGETRGWANPGFWFQLTPTLIRFGSGMYGFDKDQLENFRQSVIHPRSGKALLAAVGAVRKAGYSVGGKSRKLMPRGYEADPDRAEFLLYEGLTAGGEMPIEAAATPGFARAMETHFGGTWPIGKWLVDEVVSG